MIKYLEIWERHFLINFKPDAAISAAGNSDKVEAVDILENLDAEITNQPNSETNEVQKGEEEEEDSESRRKREIKEKALSEINALIGLDHIKIHFEKLAAKLEVSNRRGTDLKKECFGTALIGSPGTGKTVVARNYAKYLSAISVIGETYKETSGLYLADGGIGRLNRYLNYVDDAGGVLFVDDADKLVESSTGRKVLEFMFQEVEQRRGKVLLILAGREKGMQKLLGQSDRAATCLPHLLKFPDYSDDQLREILVASTKKKFDGKMYIEGGEDGLYMRIATRRVGRVRGSPEFGNAREIENLLSRIWERQCTRLAGIRKKKQEQEEKARDEVEDDDYFFNKYDILGPDPSEAIFESLAWKKLQQLTGLSQVKAAVRSIFEIVRANYQRELEEKPLLQSSFNRLFLGPPGTGKTVVAKLYAQILVDIGVLSKGEVIIQNPSDLIGQYIGHSEANTKAALTAAMGNVLVIDEAHMLYTSNQDRTGNSSDRFRQGVIDTIVSEVQGVPGEDRAVLLLGYSDRMQEMLQNCNPGLSRRFPVSDAFWFQSYALPELESILRSKLEEQVVEATEDAIKVTMDVLDKARTRLNFGNGGDVENLISKAKTNCQARFALAEKPDQIHRWVLQPQDFDPEFDRGKTATLNLKKLFSDVVGCDDIVRKLERYQLVAQSMKARDMDPKGYIPTNFIFKGPPGTGKTTTARKIAQVYYDMGFLSEASVVECSVSDLVGTYVGHSGPKTTRVFERGLGKVLFIDEAYRLSSGSGRNNFTSEVISELVDLLTKPTFLGNLVVILAGYENEMNELLGMNPGLASRFPEDLNFTPLDTQQCLRVLHIKLGKAGIVAPVFSKPKSMDFTKLVRLMGSLTTTAFWGNARDVETLSKTLCMRVLAEAQAADKELECSAEMVAAVMEEMLQERRVRAGFRKSY
ncbi:ATPases of the AAA+ class [Xylogone sp. PMI_703]|nr:ATPases of the AAA+ class [Xylogone sp. PMI_703]